MGRSKHETSTAAMLRRRRQAGLRATIPCGPCRNFAAIGEHSARMRFHADLAMITRKLRKFFRSDDGSASVELVLVLPVFLAIVGLIVDTSVIFLRQAQVYQVVQDANRSLSVGRFTTTDQVETYVVAQIPGQARSEVVSGIVTTVVQVPAGQMQIMGTLAPFDNFTVSVVASHVMER